MAAEAIAGAGARPILAAGPTPTPVATHAVRRRGCAAGFLVTASHNPPEYLGVKVVAPNGGPACSAETNRLEKECARQLAAGAPPLGSVPGRRLHPADAYVRDLVRRLDVELLATARFPIFYDAIHGSGAGVLDRILEAQGARLEVLRAEPDPCFGGGAPDPVPERLVELGRRVAKRGGRALGLATDGDADRLAVVDREGRLSETEVVALLVDHLARTRGLAGGVAISVATGTLVEHVAADAGLPVTRHPIGFRCLTEALTSGAAKLAGEESGGFAWAPFTHDKDGILAGVLMVEVAAGHRFGVRGRLRELERRHGRSACGRSAVTRRPSHARALERLATAPPRRFDGSAVRAEPTPGGVVLHLADGFAIVRASGTEPLVRIYAEAPDPRRLTARLAATAALLTRAAR
jgi:phosphomannomutase